MHKPSQPSVPATPAGPDLTNVAGADASADSGAPGGPLPAAPPPPTAAGHLKLVGAEPAPVGEGASDSGAPEPELAAPSRVAKATKGRKVADGESAQPPPVERKQEKTVDWGKFNHLLANFALIYGTDQVWDASERVMMKISAMGHAHGGDLVKMWKASEKRRTVRQCDVVFDPTGKADPQRQINLFEGFALEPAEGTVGPILDLIRFLVSRASEHDDECDQVMHWLLCWFAYPLQHPGAKLRTAVIIHGDEGAGKNFLMDTVVAIYGKYGTTVGQDELEDKFNDWRSAKLFVVGDEVSSRQELVHNKNRLKSLITSPTVQINPKGLARREEANHMNVAFLSNEQVPLALDNSDRRYLVIYTPRAKDPGYYADLSEWRANGGLAAFYHFLLHYNTEGFSPFAPAPATLAKADLIAINRKSPEQFWVEWSGGEIDLPYMSCTVAQAYRAYGKWCQRTGERFPVKQGLFSPMVSRIAEGMGKSCKVKVMKLDGMPPDATGKGAGRPASVVKKAERMLLVAEPPELPNEVYASQGEWATDCRNEFERALRSYTGYAPAKPRDEGESDD